MRLARMFAALAILTWPAAAVAQAVGMQVVGPDGAAVGTVKAVEGANLLIGSGKHDVRVPRTSFTLNRGKLLFALTREQLDSEFEKNAAVAAAAIAPGATVEGLGGTELGTIESVTESHVVVALPSGKRVRLPRKGVRGNPDGSVTIGFTAQQLEAQIG